MCYTCRYKFFLYLTTFFLYVFLPFFSISVSSANLVISVSSFSYKNFFTNYLYMTSFVDVVHSTYFLHILLLRHGDIEINLGPPKEKNKNLSYCHWNINSLIAKNLFEASQVEAYSTVYKLNFFFIPEPFLGYSIQEKYKNIYLDGYNLLWSYHPSNSKRGGVCILTEKL